uniref:Beta subunit of photoactivated adenylyl cyclase n=1 Tax=Beggiatoa sp. PS TaxID=422289 RepID=UPI0009BC73E4|nr:Chain A, Beta subunit of photoactivated adenylyl cyclase [Beggiatoa sp. PS]5MBJ_B Chain B, Beta subunit of photoactivated adenylyl cyclase [Beggiatoa sp. PS]
GSHMMKRLVYVSKISGHLSLEEIQRIGKVSIKNNQRDNITGVLLYLQGLFFQILEGENEKVDKLYKKILVDDRHTNILCLKTEYDITDRMFPNWAMKTINLNENSELMIQPIKSLLQTVTQSHRVLEKYMPARVIYLINQGINPLTVEPQLVEKIIFFSDILAFSTLTEKLPVNEVVILVNRYFSICTRIISAYGGEVTKFIGDCVMASFTKEQGDAAIRTSLDIISELKQLRHHVEATNPLHLLYTGIGLSYGHVIEGNMGSSLKMDHTLLGDAVNVAARLEALTRQLPYALAFTAGVKKCCQAQWTFINLGAHQVKGKQEAIEVYTVNEAQKYYDTLQITQLIRQTLENDK